MYKTTTTYSQVTKRNLIEFKRQLEKMKYHRVLHCPLDCK